jgi:hypothetical protein
MYMKVIETLNFNRELINRLLATGIRLEDSRYVELYNEYREMLQKGEKVTYKVRHLRAESVLPCQASKRRV